MVLLKKGWGGGQEVQPFCKMEVIKFGSKSLGFVRTTKYLVFEQCYMYCTKKGIDHYSCQHTVEDLNPEKDYSVFCVHLFTKESAIKVIQLMDKLKLDYIFVNFI